MAEKLSKVEFVKKAIPSLRKEPYKGIHTVYSGFNEAYRTYFDADPVKDINEMLKTGAIEGHPAKKGVMIYLPGDGPKRGPNGHAALKLMGLE